MRKLQKLITSVDGKRVEKMSNTFSSSDGKEVQLDKETMDKYKELNEKCDQVLKKIKERKAKRV